MLGRHSTKSVSAAKTNHAMISTVIYGWGIGTVGQLGFKVAEANKSGVVSDYSAQDEPRRLPKSKKYQQIACGVEFSLALCNEGFIHTWGKHFWEKPSMMSAPQTSMDSVVVPVAGKFVNVASGATHVAVVNDQGHVFTWGYGGSWLSGGGQLGHNSREFETHPKVVQSLIDADVKVAAVSCGGKHTLFLTDDGEVLSCGVGEYGRLGTGSTEDALVPQSLESLLDEDIVGITAGGNHSLALSASGTVFSWGRNDMGQLGQADSNMDIYSMEDFPRAIPELQGLPNGDRVTKVAAGNGRSAALTAQGNLYVWGSKLSHVPSRLDEAIFDGQRVTQVVLGGEKGMGGVACVTEDGSLWTFGDGGSNLSGRKKGGLFQGDKNKHKGQGNLVPAKVSSLEGFRVVDIFMGGGQHAFARVEIP